MKKNFSILRGGDFHKYSAPAIEVTTIEVEKGFAVSDGTMTASWDSSLEGELTWGTADNQFE